MAKLSGIAATKIAELRKALGTADDENERLRSRHLQNEIAKLRRENAALREILNSVGEQGSRDSISSPVVSPGKAATRNPTKPALTLRHTKASTPRSPTIDVVRSATINGQNYVYRDGELLLLDERQSRVFAQPRFMQPTQASKEKTFRADKEPFEYLKKKVTPRNHCDGRDSCLENFASTSGTEVRKSSEITRSRTSQDTVADFELGTTTESLETSHKDTQPSTEPAKAESTKEPSHQREFRLYNYLDDDLKYMLLPSAFGYSTLSKGMKLVQVVFWEQARLHWPTVFAQIKSGPHMVKMSWAEMSHYINLASSDTLKDGRSDAMPFRYTLTNFVKNTRNLLAHPEERPLTEPSILDHHLLYIQQAVYQMGDCTRAQQVRALRDEVAVEARRIRDEMRALDYLVALPMCEVDPDDEELEWLGGYDSKFALVIEKRYHCRGESEDYLLRVAEFYIWKSTKLGYCCRKLRESDVFWRYKPGW